MKQQSSSSTARQLAQVASSVAVILLLAAQLPVSQVECQEQLSIESRQQKDNDDLTDTIKYLEKLDKYFSQIARPRFGRSDYKQPHRLQAAGWSRFPSAATTANTPFGGHSEPMLSNVGGANGGAGSQGEEAGARYDNSASNAADLLADLARSRLAAAY